MKRTGKQQLLEIARLLGERDMAVLEGLTLCRYLTSGQIQRLHFTGHANLTAALRAANRAMVRLNELGLIKAMKRRIGGVLAGSGSYVWFLTEAGVKLLHLDDPDFTPAKRFFNPSPNFMRHTLAVAECYVELNELCGAALVKTEIEPACWRSYTGSDNRPATLKPDLFAVTRSDGFEDSWFLEIDLNTESPTVVIDKCKRYTQYYNSGIEQRSTGVFPLVVWIVPGAARKESLKRRIAESRELRLKNLFVVITPDEFPGLLRNGVQNA